MNMTEAYPRRRAYGEDLRRLAVMAVLEEGMSLAAASPTSAANARPPGVPHPEWRWPSPRKRRRVSKDDGHRAGEEISETPL